MQLKFINSWNIDSNKIFHRKKFTTKGRGNALGRYRGGAVSGWVIREETPIHPIFRRFLATFFALGYIRIIHENLQATGKQQTSKTDVCALAARCNPTT